ncbi:glycosyltransferase family 4 protein [Streptomyces avidinii]|uniref:glycosyltransferase family 4 protein n=1 Tax=Streptomyces avidinii TaxID=1895 RepID=UPI0037AEFD20
MPELAQRGWDGRIFAGSLGGPERASHATTFYRGTRTIPSDYSPAVSASAGGVDPVAFPTAPLHPSYEDRPGAPDRVFSAVSRDILRQHEAYWQQVFADKGAGDEGLLHLHHLTPMHGAAKAAERTFVTTLHGTELKFLDGALQRVALAEKLHMNLDELGAWMGDSAAERSPRHAEAESVGSAAGLSEDEMSLLLTTRWESWQHAPHWIEKMREYARASRKISVISQHDHAVAQRILQLPADRFEIIPNGVDVNVFHPQHLSQDARASLMRKWLVEEPRGWAPGMAPGSIRYSEEDLHRIFREVDGQRRPVLLWMGRFLDFKQLPLLLEAFVEVRAKSTVPPVLLVLGGYPGEWEGTHPYEVARDLGILDDVYFLGWRDHEELVQGLNCCDILTAPSVNEPFGLIYLEAMAAGVPVLVSASGGPLGYVRPSGETANGWLVAPGDVDDLTSVLVDVLSEPAEIARRGRHARDFVERHYSWENIAARYVSLYEAALG